MDTDRILQQANEVVAQYTAERVKQARHHQARCGCRSCVAGGNRWLAWLAGDDVELYERSRIRFRWEGIGIASHPSEQSAAGG